MDGASNLAAYARPRAARLAAAGASISRSIALRVSALIRSARPYFLRCFRNGHAWRAYLALVAIYGCLTFAYTYRFSFGERDCYRVFDGVLEAFQRGEALSGSLVYGYGISRG